MLGKRAIAMQARYLPEDPRSAGCLRHGPEDFDGALGTGSASEPAVSGEQDGVHRFGERDIRRVVEREVVTQFPAPAQQRTVRRALGRQRREVIQRQARATAVQCQLIWRRRTEATSRSASSGMASRSPRSRARAWSPSLPSSARATTSTLASTTSTVFPDRGHGCLERDRAARSPAGRSRISSSVGWSASSISRARRYSCSDWWAAAARWRSTACVRSGTSLI